MISNSKTFLVFPGAGAPERKGTIGFESASNQGHGVWADEDVKVIYLSQCFSLLSLLSIIILCIKYQLFVDDFS